MWWNCFKEDYVQKNPRAAATSTLFLAFLTISMWADTGKAQNNNCFGSREFLRGDSSKGSTVCDYRYAIPINFCTGKTLDEQDRIQLYIEAEFGEFYIPIWPEDVEDTAVLADAARLKALLDEEFDENVGGLFYILYTALLSSLVSDLTQDSMQKLSSSFLVDKGLWQQYFIHRSEISQTNIMQKIECAVRCGSTAINPKALTRSRIYQKCIKG